MADSTSGFLTGNLYRNDTFQWCLLPKKNQLISVLNMSSHPEAHTLWGGPGSLAGTISADAAPVVNIVRFYEASTGIYIRSVFSDINGQYSFPGLRMGIAYTITVTDKDKLFNDVIAARVYPV